AHRLRGLVRAGRANKLAARERLVDRREYRPARRGLPADAAEILLPRPLPLAAELHRRALARRKRTTAGAAAWAAPRAVLRRLLLVDHAADVCRRIEQPRLDAGAGCCDGDREERALGPADQRTAGRSAPDMGADLGSRHRHRLMV